MVVMVVVGKDPKHPVDYQPISILSNLSKIIVKVTLTHLNDEIA